MRLNKSTSHAIRILIACTKADGKLVKAADLSAKLDITLQNVFKIVHILSRAGLIAGQRGRNGGIALARPAEEIAVGDIVRAMEATDMELDVDGSVTASRSLRDVNRVLDDALGAFISVLDRHSLADMAKSASVGNGRKATSKPAKPSLPKKTARSTAKAGGAVSSARMKASLLPTRARGQR